MGATGPGDAQEQKQKWLFSFTSGRILWKHLQCEELASKPREGRDNHRNSRVSRCLEGASPGPRQLHQPLLYGSQRVSGDDGDTHGARSPAALVSPLRRGPQCGLKRPAPTPRPALPPRRRDAGAKAPPRSGFPGTCVVRCPVPQGQTRPSRLCAPARSGSWQQQQPNLTAKCRPLHV